MHGLMGGSWKRNRDRARATEMNDTRGNPAVTSGSETYRRSSSPRQLSTLRETCCDTGFELVKVAVLQGIKKLLTSPVPSTDSGLHGCVRSHPTNCVIPTPPVSPAPGSACRP